MKKYYGEYGGQFVPETLIPALDELENAYGKFRKDWEYQKQLNVLLEDFAGRPTPLYFVKRLSEELGCEIWLKKEKTCSIQALTR